MTRRRLLGALSAFTTMAAVSAGLAPAASATTPAPASHAHVYRVASNAVSVTWRNPAGRSFAATVVRLARGTSAPRSPSRGAAVAVVRRPGHSVTATRLAPGTTYAFALFATDGHGHYAQRVVVVGRTAPAPVTALAATKTSSTIALAWRNPPTASYAGVIVRYARGTVAPADPGKGVAVRLATARATRASVTGLLAGTSYSFAVWARDAANRCANRAALTVRTAAVPDVTMQDAIATPTSLQYVWNNPATSDFGGVTIVRKAGTTIPTLGSYDKIVKLDRTKTHWTDTSLGVHRQYSYRVFARDSAGNYAPGVVQSGWTTFSDARIEGRVTQAGSTSPLAGVHVEAISVDGGFSDEATTDAGGNYSVVLYAPGDYAVCFDGHSATGGTSTEGYQSKCDAGVAITPWGRSWTTPPAGSATHFVPDGNHDVVDASLAAGGAISGTVRSQVGHNPLRGVSVSVFSATGPVASTIATDSAGNYQITGLPPDSYTVCFDGATVAGAPVGGYLAECLTGHRWTDPNSGAPAPGSDPVTVTAGAVADASADLTQGAAIVGTVTAAGSGVPLVGVDVTVTDGANFLASALTDQSGAYAFTGLDDGSYTVCFDGSAVAGAGYQSECNADVPWNRVDLPAGVTPVAITLQSAAQVDAVLAAGGALAGTVTEAGGSAAPLSNVKVTAYPSGTSVVAATSSTDDTGAYSIRGLPAGTYDVCFDGGSAAGGSSAVGYDRQCYQDQSWDGLAADVPAGVTPVPVTPTGNTDQIDATLAPQTSVSGTVAGAGGPPLAGVRVVLFTAGGNPAGSTTTDGSGRYAFHGVASGDRLCVDGTSAGYQSQCYDGSPAGVLWAQPLVDPPPIGAAGLTLVPGVLTTVDVTLATLP